MTRRRDRGARSRVLRLRAPRGAGASAGGLRGLRVRAAALSDNHSWTAAPRRRHRRRHGPARAATTIGLDRSARRARIAGRRDRARCTFTGAGRDDDRRLHAHAPARPTATARRPAARTGYYAIYALGGTVVRGRRATTRSRRATGSTPRAAGTAIRRTTSYVPRSTVSRASFPALAGYTGDATHAADRGRLLQRRGTTACTHRRRRRRSPTCISRRARSTLNDPTRAGRVRRGLRPAGRRRAATARTPVTLDATDNGGIRRVEIVDLTRRRRGRRRARTTAPARAPTRARPARPRSRKPCPNLSNETHAPDQRWPPAGARCWSASTDAGRQRHRAAARTWSTSSRRPTAAPLNGSGATEGGTLTARFTRQAQARTRPSATASACAVTRPPAQLRGQADLRRAAATCSRATAARARTSSQRWATTTTSDGAYRLTRARAAPRGSSRSPGRSHVHDPSPQANAYLTLNARASSSLRATPRGRSASARRCGCAARCAARVPRARRAGDLPGPQRRRRASRRSPTAARTARGASRVHYRFRSGASRGRTFTFRVKLRGDARFPYALGYSKRVRVRECA